MNSTSHLEDRSRRILIAGHEIGGQMQLLADTMRNRWLQATAVAYNQDFRGYQNDVMLAGSGIHGALDRFWFFIWAVQHYDVFHFFWGVSLFSWWKFHLLDLPILRLMRKRVIVHFRGLDIIDIRYFDYLRSKSRGEAVEPPPLSRPDQLAKVRKWLKYADEVLVSEPDLLAVVPNAKLSPQVIDLSYWQSTNEPLSRKDGIIRIVHAPSSRRKKGTDFIESAIKKIKDKGYAVELILAEDLPHHKIRELYEIADIGIDQVLYGWHGKVSVELMALGKPVICNIDPTLREYRPELPIVHGSPENLEVVLEQLIGDAKLRADIGAKSYMYVRKYHDVNVIVDELMGYYDIAVKTLVKETINSPGKW